MTTTIETEIDQAKAQAGRERLGELEDELERAGRELGAATIEFERARFRRDQARYSHNRAMGMHERFLSGKDA
jgi:hypothetical protein